MNELQRFIFKFYLHEKKDSLLFLNGKVNPHFLLGDIKLKRLTRPKLWTSKKAALFIPPPSRIADYSTTGHINKVCYSDVRYSDNFSTFVKVFLFFSDPTSPHPVMDSKMVNAEIARLEKMFHELDTNKVKTTKLLNHLC